MDYIELARNFGFNLKMIRMKKSITQATLAEILHCQESQISNIETGKVNVTLKTISKIATALNVDVVKFFDFED